jgi:alkylmercury lyase
MPHRLAPDVGDITTWCALDPLLIAPLITDEARVESADPVSGEPIRLTVTADGVRDLSPGTARVSMLAPDGPFGHDVVESFCHYVHFFASPETGEHWVAEHPGTFLLTVDEAFQVATRSWPALFRDALVGSPGKAADIDGGGPRAGRQDATAPSAARIRDRSSSRAAMS